MIKAAMYLRKSRAEEMASIEETLSKHKSALIEYAESHEISIVKIYEEVVSGESLFARPEMLKLLEDIEDGMYDAVLCMDMDRLGRGGMRDQGIIIDTFKYSDTKIITPDKTYDLNDDTDEELTEFKTFIARREYKMIRKRMHRGLMQTIKNGAYVANAPFGYRKTIKNKLPTLEIYEEEAKYVRLIYDRYLNGIGAATIAEELNMLGAKPHRSEKWNRNSVRHILRNPTFAGKVVWNRISHVRKGTRGNEKHISIYQPEENWIVVDGLHEPIISEEMFKQAQHIRKDRYIPSQNNGEIKNSLAGIVTCRNCGYNMQIQGKSKGVPYLLCGTKGCCAGAKVEYVEAALLQAIEQNLAVLKLAEKENLPIQADTELSVLSLIEKEIAKNEQKISRLYGFLEDGTYDKVTFQERMKLAQAEEKALRKKRAQAEDDLMQKRRENRAATIAKIENVLELYQSQTPASKNQMLKSIVSKAIYSKDKKTKPEDFSLFVEIRSSY